MGVEWRDEVPCVTLMRGGLVSGDPHVAPTHLATLSCSCESHRWGHVDESTSNTIWWAKFPDLTSGSLNCTIFERAN